MHPVIPRFHGSDSFTTKILQILQLFFHRCVGFISVILISLFVLKRYCMKSMILFSCRLFPVSCVSKSRSAPKKQLFKSVELLQIEVK